MFSPPPSAGEKGLFYLAVTKAWLQQVVLALVLLCHSSCRGVMEFFRSVLDCPLALGSVHNRVMRAVAQARQSNAVEDLHAVRAAGHDEIFQSGQKVAVGVAGFDLVLSAGGRGKPRRRDRGDPSVWDLTAKG